MDTLQELVAVAWRNAHENGFLLDELTDGEIAEDMQHKDSEIEKFAIRDIERAVRAVRAERQK